MHCLYNYIGLLGCGTSVPESGLFVNSQPGITTESIAAIADNEQENYLGVWEDIQNRAALKFNTLVLSRLKKKFKIKSILDTVDIGRKITTQTTLPEAKWKGINISYNTPNINSLTQIHLQEIVLYLSENSSTTINIFNADTGDVLFTTEISSKIGWVKIFVGKSFYAKNIFIAYDATNIIQTKLPLPFYQAESGCNCTCSCTDCSMTIHGAESEINTPTTLIKGSNTFGLSAIFSLKCSLENLVCNNKELFAGAWLNLLSAEVMTERLYSDRVNRFTTIDRKRAEELRQEFDAAFIGEIENVVDSLELADKCCVECYEFLKIEESVM